MKNRAASGIMLSLVMINILTLAVKIHSIKAEPKTIIVPDEYSSIQEAINSANEGDVIFVKSGTYFEHVDIGKSVKIIGENKWNTIISGFDLSGAFWGLFEVHSANITINGFTVRDHEMGIYVSNSQFCNISDNIIVNNEYGIDMRSSRNNFIGYNTISESSSYGIVISEHSENNVLRGNNLNENNMNLGVFSYFNDIDSSNVADGKPIYYLVNEKNKRIPNDAGYVAVVNSTNIVVKDLTISNNQGVLLAYTNNSIIENLGISNTLWGVQLDHSYNNTIRGSTFTKNIDGIRMDYSNKNTIIENTISMSYSGSGISLYSSNDNTIANNTISIDWIYADSFLISEASLNIIYHNNIILRYNRGVFLPDSRHNYWDNGFEGNYWSNYNGTDTDGDGIGDTPYIIDTVNVDNYPLVILWSGAPDTIPPVANAGENQIAAEFEMVIFSGSDSYDNVRINSYEWDFGDGTKGTGTTVAHIFNQTYSTVTNYKVTLTVKDVKGNSNSTSITITILKDANKDGIPDLFDSDNDGMPNIWEIEYGLNPNDPTDATGDLDGDLLLNIEEYHFGTDPHAFNISWKSMVLFLTFFLSIAIVASIWLLYKQRTLIKQKREIGKTSYDNFQTRQLQEV